MGIRPFHRFHRVRQLRLRDRASHLAKATLSVGKWIRPALVPALWLGLLSLSGGILVGAFLWLASIPPLPDCKKLPALASDSDRLYCAERAARSGKVESLLAGFSLVRGWTASHPLHNRANRALKEWSKSTLAIAQGKATKGDFEGAIELARKIPTNSPTQKEVKTAIASWQKSQNQVPILEKGFELALKRQEWQTAEDKTRALFRLKTDEKGQQRINRLRQRLVAEQSAREQLQSARFLVETAPQDADTLAQAIAQIEAIPPGSYASAEAQADVALWGQSLLSIALERLTNADRVGAIAAARAVPFSVTPPIGVRDLIWFTRAHTLVTDKIPKASLNQQLWRVWNVLLHVRQIQANSPFYQPGQALIPQLEAQIQDLTQLQAAHSAASLGQIPSLQLAIQIAQTIQPDRPQRLLAQTLIAGWQKDLQQVQDRPTLAKAHQLAAPQKIADLKAAIAQATLIAPGRPLRVDAQNHIKQWQGQIQAIEDRPLLNQAKALSKQKKLQAAIQTANKIRPNRSLYRDAQVSIKGWTEQIQITADRPILNKAKTLADGGNLSAAIDMASQISSDRALHPEAQAAIAGWIAQQEVSYQRLRRFPPRYGRYESAPSFGFRPPRRPF
ncbi:hypothetical protein K9N68_22430 [Kovacikia minuta CCNUW1]|uniref:hypothetical protein n=1 Tax=Kovacikia minuta TaxID=2931930 RepID=UPI001CCE981F|nr:hypothetical protein [Kovacikia minuta]UBF24436.1 hypothetical protein K9N68_22430 [Kovacikia minuta CCNUW1]